MFEFRDPSFEFKMIIFYFALGSFNLALISDELLRGGVLHLPYRSKPQIAW